MRYDYEIMPEMRQFDSINGIQYMHQQKQQSSVRVERHDVCTNTRPKDNPIDVSDKIIEWDMTIQEDRNKNLVNIETNTSDLKIDNDQMVNKEKNETDTYSKMDLEESKDEKFGVLIK